jgi:hypothetical protein
MLLCVFSLFLPGCSILRSFFFHHVFPCSKGVSFSALPVGFPLLDSAFSQAISFDFEFLAACVLPQAVRLSLFNSLRDPAAVSSQPLFVCVHLEFIQFIHFSS